MALYLPRADVDDALLEGAVDTHCHAGPCIYGKDYDEVETARMMRNARYRGVLFKQHLLGANRIKFIRDAVPGIEIFGGVALNHYVGGLNPFAVASCIIFGGKEVKFPNIHSAHHIKTFGTPTYASIPPTGGVSMEKRLAQMVKGIEILDEDGNLIPVVGDILSLIAEADIGVETGHLSPKECFALIREARKMGITKVWQTHGNWWKLYQFSPTQLVELADEGAMIEVTSNFALASSASDVSSQGAEYTAEIIRTVGPNRCVMASDFGTVGRFNAVEGLRVFAHTMMRYGIKREEIDMMIKENPSRLLGL